jgi:hypothetical protein
MTACKPSGLFPTIFESIASQREQQCRKIFRTIKKLKKILFRLQLVEGTGREHWPACRQMFIEPR